MVTALRVIGGRRVDIAPACPGCGHPQHAVYACRSAALFTREARCGCDSHYGDLPRKWRGPDNAA